MKRHIINKENREALAFIVPLVVFIALFMLYPIVGTFWVSLWRDVTFLSKEFSGFENYSRLFQDVQFWQSMSFTLLFTLSSVFIEIVLGVIFALVVHERFRFRGVVRGIILIPWAIPCVISARIWQLIYRYDYGLANYLLQNLFGFHINWLGNSKSAFFSLVLTDVWRMTPFVAIIILAGLQVIPEDLYQQAKIDGVNILQRFSKITLPLLRPILTVALLFRTIDALRVFDIIYVITGGGPGSATMSLSLYGHTYFLLGDFGYGSSVSIILCIMALTISFFYIKVGKFMEIST
ncbi:MAG: sugar ABC transporter permease [Thermodesulfobacteriota bacterium]|nr:sugar ABC transporter permease [Thermodesulfobacteriota bacterium]